MTTPAMMNVNFWKLAPLPLPSLAAGGVWFMMEDEPSDCPADQSDGACAEAADAMESPRPDRRGIRDA
jgi:hypothetical protein